MLLSVQVGDSLNWETAKLIIQTQYNLALYGVTILIGVSVLIVGASWLYNLYFERRQIESVMQSKKLELSSSIKKDFSEYQVKMKEGLAEARIELEKSLDNKMKGVEGEICRLHAMAAEQEKMPDIGALSWARSIPNFAASRDDELLEVGVEGLVRDLEQCKSLDGKSIGEIKACTSSIPKMLFLEKIDIERRLGQLSEAPEVKKE